MWNILGSGSNANLPVNLPCLPECCTEKQRELVTALCSDDLCQDHLFEDWPDSDEQDALKKMFLEQLEELDESYPTGLAGYIERSRELLGKSAKGLNPLDDWKPSVPIGKTFTVGTKEYEDTEALGKAELGSVGFVLVAGGLGERLGYSQVKVGLPTELATEMCYLQYYIEYILAVQKKYAGKKTKLPLCIMTSHETNDGTVLGLVENDYFGMDKEQITIVLQGKGVPALLNNDAMIALEARYKIMTKPHGHGDIHALLYTHDVAKKWASNGIKWMTFFQDTNGLAFHTLPLKLGVSLSLDLAMNSLAIPRKAKEAVGAITKLTNKVTGAERTVNVEYNQLDPLLRASRYSKGDVEDTETGYSPFPGNTNQLLVRTDSYLEFLEKSKGIMPEFINPKYTDKSKTTFIRPARLECMMQDVPWLLADDKKVGFTMVEAAICYSPVKNSTADGVKLQEAGLHPQVAATGEADQYAAQRIFLRSIGVKIEDDDLETYNGISIVGGPQVVIAPNALICPGDYKSMFPTPEKVHISKRSSLVIKGPGTIVIESLQLDGALEIECKEGADETITDAFISNLGWKRVALKGGEDEAIAMRGYALDKIETCREVYKGERCVIS